MNAIVKNNASIGGIIILKSLGFGGNSVQTAFIKRRHHWLNLGCAQIHHIADHSQEFFLFHCPGIFFVNPPAVFYQLL